MSNIFDPDFIMEHELVFVGSPETVTRKLRKAAETGLFNTFMGEFNFADLPEADLMRSIRLFGEKVMPGAARLRTVLSILMAYKILIAGAGLGGLTAASCLMKAGHEVEIYEQAPELGEIGAGIQVSANAMHVLRDLGLESRDPRGRRAARPPMCSGCTTPAR